MCLTKGFALRRPLAHAITLGLILIAGGVGRAQQLPYQSTPKLTSTARAIRTALTTTMITCVTGLQGWAFRPGTRSCRPSSTWE